MLRHAVDASHAGDASGSCASPLLVLQDAAMVWGAQPAVFMKNTYQRLQPGIRPVFPWQNTFTQVISLNLPDSLAISSLINICYAWQPEAENMLTGIFRLVFFIITFSSTPRRRSARLDVSYS